MRLKCWNILNLLNPWVISHWCLKTTRKKSKTAAQCVIYYLWLVFQLSIVFSNQWFFKPSFILRAQSSMSSNTGRLYCNTHFVWTKGTWDLCIHVLSSRPLQGDLADAGGLLLSPYKDSISHVQPSVSGRQRLHLYHQISRARTLT